MPLHLVIDGLDDFANFILLIRGEQDAAKIRAMVARLAESTAVLKSTEDANAANNPK
jgi:hypothetical protein